MPIEIKELHIKTTISSDEGSLGSGSKSQPASADKENALIAAVVEKVLKVLKEKTER